MQQCFIICMVTAAFIVAISLAFDNITGGQFTWMTIADIIGSESCSSAQQIAVCLGCARQHLLV